MFSCTGWVLSNDVSVGAGIGRSGSPYFISASSNSFLHSFDTYGVTPNMASRQNSNSFLRLSEMQLWMLLSGKETSTSARKVYRFRSSCTLKGLGEIFLPNLADFFALPLFRCRTAALILWQARL